MREKKRKKPSAPRGYPKLERVLHGCINIALTQPDPIFRTCDARLHDPSKREESALLQVFTNHTLAAHWLFRDVGQRKPRQMFTSFKRGRSTKFHTPGIKVYLEQRYKTIIQRRYTLNANVLTGLFGQVAQNVSAWLQNMTDAEKKGKLKLYYESCEHIVGYGRNDGKRLGDLGRRTIYGYAFLTPTKAQCQEALQHLNVLLNRLPEEKDRQEQAENYCMKSGSRRGDKLGGMRLETLKRLKFEVERDLNRMDTIEALRKAAQTYLRYTPDSFPYVGHDGLTRERYNQLFDEHLEALEEFGALPDPHDEASILRNLTEDERDLFYDLQCRYWKVVSQPKYFPLSFSRADGVVQKRDIGLLYDPDKKRYLLLVYVLHGDSRRKRPLIVRGRPYDVNNPDVVLTSSRQPSTAMLFELEMGAWQRDMLDAARQHTDQWKSEGKTSGSIRSGRLHAHYDKRRKQWWFEVQLAVGFKPEYMLQPQHVIGVHINPRDGTYVTIMRLDGTLRDHFRLDEARIAHLLYNRNPEEQAQIDPEKRTAAERNHRTADALVALCEQYQAQLGMENIGYRGNSGPNQMKPQEDSSRTIFWILAYKLPLAHLPKPVDVDDVSPRRDCGYCGRRHDTPQTEQEVFTCPRCYHSEHRAANTAREVARRVLWNITRRKPPKHAPKPSQQAA